MKKNKVVSVLLCFSVCFLVLQFDIISYVSKPRPVGELGRETRKHTAVTSAPIKDQFANVKTFTSACDDHRVEVFLVDPVVLDKVMTNHSTARNNCRFFCTQDKVISFAVLASDWRPKEITTSLEDSGFTIVTFTDNDPRTVHKDTKSSVPVPVHYFFMRSGFLLHLLVFYERGKDFLWHGALTWGQWEKGDIEEVKIDLHQVNFPLHAGAYDWMEVVRVRMDDLAVFAPRFPLLLLKQIPQSRFIECNYSRAKVFFSRHVQDKSSDALMFRKRARNLLARAKETLTELGIPFWISSGTLLGWFRQCDTIPYSLDVDIGIFIKDYDDRLISAMQSSGLPLKHRFGKPSDSFELSFQSGDVKLDIFFFYEEDDHMWNGGTQAKSGKKFKYVFPKFTMCWIEFLNIRLMAPCETEAYIAANYGPNWLQPVPVWDWKSSPSNVQENGIWPLEEWPDVIQSF